MIGSFQTTLAVWTLLWYQARFGVVESFLLTPWGYNANAAHFPIRSRRPSRFCGGGSSTRSAAGLRLLSQRTGSKAINKTTKRTTRRSWDENYEELQEYKATHGDCNVPLRYHDARLAQWVYMQRKRATLGTLRQDRWAKLDAIGLELEPLDRHWEEEATKTTKIISSRTWEENYKKLEEYKETHGECNVPSTYHDTSLARFVASQRNQARKGTLRQDWLDKLNAIGLDLDPLTRGWEDSYEMLKEYKAAHGDCNVPSTYHDARLAQWVYMQRKKARKGTLRQDRCAKLDDIGLELSPWERNYEKLKEYKAIHGDCNVPSGYDDTRLAAFVHNHRARARRGLLKAKQWERLNELGFVWDFRSESWKGMLQKLKEYKSEHGNCDVPSKVNPRLSNWIRTQRRCAQSGSLKPDQRAHLDAVGFVYSKRDRSGK